MPVYILHFETPLHHAKHYVGFSQNKRTLKQRLEHHKHTNWTPPEPGEKIGKCTGPGANFMGVVNHFGIEWKLAKVFQNADRNFERKLKNTNNTARYCPICNPKATDYHPKERITTHAE